MLGALACILARGLNEACVCLCVSGYVSGGVEMDREEKFPSSSGQH